MIFPIVKLLSILDALFQSKHTFNQKIVMVKHKAQIQYISQ